MQQSNARINGYFIRPEIHLRVLLATHKCTCSLSICPRMLLHTENTTQMDNNKMITAATKDETKTVVRNNFAQGRQF